MGKASLYGNPDNHQIEFHRIKLRHLLIPFSIFINNYNARIAYRDLSSSPSRSYLLRIQIVLIRAIAPLELPTITRS